mmetsp:Transcript_18941/g.37701  ORF Transcript_18941/g.37701 Transcript_18941/m.37701 type:complete len:115 (-) Transcript_18941:46-390(-)
MTAIKESKDILEMINVVKNRMNSFEMMLQENYILPPPTLKEISELRSADSRLDSFQFDSQRKHLLGIYVANSKHAKATAKPVDPVTMFEALRNKKEVGSSIEWQEVQFWRVGDP